MTDSDGFFGYAGITDGNSDYNAADFQIRQMLSLVRTATPVQVKAVHGGGAGAPPTVDVLILVNMVDGQGNKTDHGVVFGIPVMRIQGGVATIIVDPVVGDVGLMLCADRDISTVVSNDGKQSNPGSFRRHDLADGVYLGGILNKATPTSYVRLLADGSIHTEDKTGNVILMDNTGIKITSAMSKVVNINGLKVDSSGNLTTPGGVIAGFGGADSVGLQTHIHSAGNNFPPTPGS